MDKGEVKTPQGLIGLRRRTLDALRGGGPANSFSSHFRIRQSWIALTLHMIPYATVILVAHGILYLLLSHNTGSVEILQSIVQPTSLTLRTLLLLELIRRYFNREYRFSVRSVSERMGKLSINLHVAHIRYGDIREIRVEQGLLGRILQFGTIKLGTASSNEHEVVLEDIDNVEEIALEIHQRRKRNQQDSESDV